MPTLDPFTPTRPFEYECVDCSGRVRSDQHPGTCADCGGDMRSVSVPRE